MDLSTNGARFLQRLEGWVGKWYKDPVGVGTIGTGMTWRSGAFREWWAKNKPGVPFGPGATMTRAEGEDALKYLVDKEYGKAVNDFLGTKKVPQHVYDAMVSVVYNLGPGALKWKWAKAIKEGRYGDAAALLRQTGTTAGGRVLSGLVARRKDEAKLVTDGIYTGITTKPDPVPVAPGDAMADGLLMRGERGPDIKTLIENLAALGYYNGTMDDIFGPRTEQAVMAFQKDHGLKVDGIAGPKTLAAVDAAMAKSNKVAAASTAATATASTAAAVQAGLPWWQALLIGVVIGVAVWAGVKWWRKRQAADPDP